MPGFVGEHVSVNSRQIEIKLLENMSDGIILA